MAGNELKADQIPKVRLGTVDEVRLYQITESELDILEHGSPSSTFFNFAIFFLSTAFSFIASIMAAPIGNERVFTVFTVIIVVGLALGVILLILWWKSPNQCKKTITKIRGRISDPISEEKK